MAHAARPPVWVNLEYLSAEPWIEQAHGLPSPHPRLPLVRHFWFPGFTPQSGGLLRERGLIARRDAVRAQPRGARLPAALQPTVGAALEEAAGPAVLVAMFCYANAALPRLLDAWSAADEPMVCVVPHGVAHEALTAWQGAPWRDGARVRRGALCVVSVPFVSQDDYDRLLWTCDVNFVRGEDSFVRAQWAGAPFVWHAYPQDASAHRVKVDAFLARYLDGAPASTAAAVTGLWHAWNGDDAGADIGARWAAFRAESAALWRHGARWTARLAALPELAAGLWEFCRNRL
jgi:uncharacterized repeat protein (TIGR03837 family)